MMKDDITIAKMIAMIEYNQSNNKSLMTRKWSRILTNILECNQYQYFQHDFQPEQLKRRVLQGSQSDHGTHTWKHHHNHHISRHLCKQIWHNCSHYWQPSCKIQGDFLLRLILNSFSFLFYLIFLDNSFCVPIGNPWGFIIF